jgi:hypothetical protein
MGMLTILRVRGASCRDIEDLSEGVLHRWCPSWFLVDLHFPRGDSGRCHNPGGTTTCAPMSSLFVSRLSCCCPA